MVMMKQLANTDVEQLNNNLLKISGIYQDIVNQLLQKKTLKSAPMLDSNHMSTALFETLSKIWQDPSKLLECQLQYSQNYLQLIHNMLNRCVGEDVEPLYKPSSKDFRFKDELWQNNLYFDFLKQSYLMNANWLQQILNSVDIDDRTAKKANFYLKQIIDAAAPTNFLLTNPQVLKETFTTNGDNLVKGLQQMQRDIERSKRIIDINTSDTAAFEVGKNIAITKGSVVFENEIMQIIHYHPTTKTQYKVPLLIIPPCINKYYILDLKQENSFVKWSLDKGYDIFLISWVNPDSQLAHLTFDDYIEKGIITAVDYIVKHTKVKQINTIGYCLGGTMLTACLAYMKAIGDTRINSSTFFTTLLDFENSGELGIFIDEEQLNNLESRLSEEGVFEGADMSHTFNSLRANDMIWNYYINNYLMGKEASAFDLLFWNSDSTRLPAKLHSYYLRNMYLNNSLIKSNQLKILGVEIDLKTIDIDCYFLSAKDDHIAPWQATYAVTRIFKGDITFVLSASGHIAGVINPPVKNKYCYWLNKSFNKSSDIWFEKAQEHQGSWWENWHKWCAKQSGIKVNSVNKLGLEKEIEAAPGSYVKVRC